MKWSLPIYFSHTGTRDVQLNTYFHLLRTHPPHLPTWCRLQRVALVTVDTDRTDGHKFHVDSALTRRFRGRESRDRCLSSRVTFPLRTCCGVAPGGGAVAPRRGGRPHRRDLILAISTLAFHTSPVIVLKLGVSVDKFVCLFSFALLCLVP